MARAARIRVRALDTSGKAIEFDAEGLLAVCIQHELDHLVGKLFVDYLSELKRQRLKKRATKARRRDGGRGCAGRSFARPSARHLNGRIIFAGSPAFATPTLQRLADLGHRPVAVLTQPDRPAGRGRTVAAGPVKQLAIGLGIPVLQPATLKTGDAQAALHELAPDLLVVVAYGLLLPAAGAGPAAPRLRERARFAAAPLARRVADPGRPAGR